MGRLRATCAYLWWDGELECAREACRVECLRAEGGGTRVAVASSATPVTLTASDRSGVSPLAGEPRLGVLALLAIRVLGE